MGRMELSLMKKTIMIIRDWDAFQSTCRQWLKILATVDPLKVEKR